MDVIALVGPSGTGKSHRALMVARQNKADAIIDDGILIKDNKIQLVDVRTVAEYSEGHIPGSLNINVMDENFAAAVDELLQKDQPVAVYCKSGRRSRNAAKLLVKKGFKVYNLDKGILNWIDEGMEIEK